MILKLWFSDIYNITSRVKMTEIFFFLDIYSHGLNKVQRLLRESHVFTVEEGQTAKDKEKEDAKKIRIDERIRQYNEMKSNFSKQANQTVANGK